MVDIYDKEAIVGKRRVYEKKKFVKECGRARINECKSGNIKLDNGIDERKLKERG